MIFADIQKLPGKSNCPGFRLQAKFWASLFYTKKQGHRSVERVKDIVLTILENPEDLNFHGLYRILG